MRKGFFKLFGLISVCSLLFAACGGTGGGGGTPTPTVSPTPIPQPTVTPEPFIGVNHHMCNTGETVILPFLTDGTARFTLNDGECTPAKNNQNDEYTLILYNTTYSNIGFNISSPAEIDPFTRILAKESEDLDPTRLVNAVDRQSYDYYKSLINESSSSLPVLKKQSGSKGKISADYSPGDEMEYKIRCDYNNPNIFCTESAVLRASGPNINIFVDRNVPFDDGNPKHLATANLEKIRDVYENNIWPLQRTLLGRNCSEFSGLNCPLSDIDSNDKISVIITPVLNWLPLTHPKPEDAPMPAVYVDTRNLLPFNDISNAGSNEQEVIFLYAPDDEGYFNYREHVDIDFWLSKGIYAWLSVGLQKLISYNFHVFLYGSTPELDWIDFGLGGLLADLAGFNIWTAGVWKWLDAPAYEELLTSSEFGCSLVMAGPYLFMLYMLNSQVDTTLEETLNDGMGNMLDSDLAFLGNFMSNLSGVENLENAIEIDFNPGSESKFSALFRNWTVALLTSGTNRSDLQISTEFKYYYVRSDTTNILPDSRVYGSGIATNYGAEIASSRYGADGGAGDFNGAPNPVGLDLNNFNLIGDSSDPTWRALIENPHEFTYAPGNKFYGAIRPFTANFIRLGGLFESTTDLVVTATSPSIKGFVVKRSNLPSENLLGRTRHPRVYSESVFGSTDQTPEVLCDTNYPGPNQNLYPVKLDLEYYTQRSDIGNTVASGEIGATMTIVGKIDKADKVAVYNFECKHSFRDVPDFDKYQITIPSTLGDEGNLAIWLERQADGVDGKSSLIPMLAVVSWDDVPYPSGRYSDPSDPNDPRTNSRMKYRWLTTRTDSEGGSTINENGAPSYPPRETQNECIAAYDPGAPNYWDLESPSEMTGYSGCFGDFTNVGNAFSWVITGLPDVIYDREILKPAPADPFVASGPDSRHYDPRSMNLLNLDCIDRAPDEERSPTDPDDFLSPNELRRPSLFQEQILIEMSRAQDLAIGDGNFDANLTIDTLTVDIDSKDDDSQGMFTGFDMGNNVGGRSVTNKENSMILACNGGLCDTRLVHIYGQFHASDDLSQEIYNFDTTVDTPYLELLPGETYMIIVGGAGGTTGNYELKLRKIVPANVIRGAIEVTP